MKLQQNVQSTKCSKQSTHYNTTLALEKGLKNSPLLWLCSEAEALEYGKDSKKPTES